MNEVAQKKLHDVAVQVVAYQISEGRIPPERADFMALVKEFETAVLTLAYSFGIPANEPSTEKPAKAPRKRNEAKATASAKVSPEAMQEFLGKQAHAMSLGRIAELLGCSDGQAKRALKKLGAAVRCEEGASNGPGKPPMLYSLAQ